MQIYRIIISSTNNQAEAPAAGCQSGRIPKLVAFILTYLVVKLKSVVS
jgi:hypothetical protein